MKLKIAFLTLITLLLAACSSSRPPLSTRDIETGVDPDSWSTIPAGEFLFTRHEKEIDLAYSYEMMVTDVTNAQFAGYLNSALASSDLEIEGDMVVGYYAGDPFSGHKHEKEIPEGNYPHYPLNAEGSRIRYLEENFVVDPGYANHPVTMVTWFGAKGYCEAQGGRLPSEVEWEKAARGTEDNRAYPWGNQLMRNQANYVSSNDIFEKVSGNRADTTPVGFYNGRTYDGYQTLSNASPYGLYDMAGNVWQWTGDVYEGTHNRYLRGGSMADYGYNLRVFARNNVRPDYQSPRIGFRCLRDLSGSQ